MTQHMREDMETYLSPYIKDKKKVKIIENSIFNYIQKHFQNLNMNFNVNNPKQTEKYMNKCKSIIYNIETSLKDNINNNKLPFDLKDIAEQSHIVLNPQKWNTNIHRKELYEQQMQQKPQATTDQFFCTKCKQNKCTYSSAQLRSSDEPETIFVTCVNCNNHWRIG
jgi:DNA-directed RNA polymerase subunit M/transcription elongation factor TFIIS